MNRILSIGRELLLSLYVVPNRIRISRLFLYQPFLGRLPDAPLSAFAPNAPNQDDRRKPDQADNRRLRRREADIHLHPQ